VSYLLHRLKVLNEMHGVKRSSYQPSYSDIDEWSVQSIMFHDVSYERFVAFHHHHHHPYIYHHNPINFISSSHESITVCVILNVTSIRCVHLDPVLINPSISFVYITIPPCHSKAPSKLSIIILSKQLAPFASHPIFRYIGGDRFIGLTTLHIKRCILNTSSYHIISYIT
jgi:hypothetical protein